MHHHTGWVPALLAFAIAGCAAQPGPQHIDEVRSLVAARHDAENLPAADAPRQFLLDSPAARAAWARCGIAEAEVREALRLRNPSLGFLRLTADGLRETSFSLTQDLLDLVFAGYRRRQGGLATQQAMQHCATTLLQLATDVRMAFVDHAAARHAQQAAHREQQVAQLSAELARQYHAAGNITELALRLEEAAAGEAALRALERDAAVAGARSHLDSLLGRRSDEARQDEQASLPLLDAEPAPLAELQELALAQRLDLAALRAERDLRATQARHARRWGWLGGTTLVAARETRSGEPALEGGGVDVELPVFDRGTNRRRQAASWLALREAQLDALATGIANEVAARRAQVQLRREAVSSHARPLVQLRERVATLTRQRADFMIVGSFELIAARRQQFAAWQTYVESVAQLARAQIHLAQALGTAPPGVFRATDTLELENLP